MNISYLMPEGYLRLMMYRRRFHALGFPVIWSCFRKYRTALEVSHFELLPRRLFPLKCVVDVGANVGGWSIGISRLAMIPRLIAFEPVPDVFNQLRENTRRYPHIHCVQSAVGATVGQVIMNMEHQSELSSILPITKEGLSYHNMKEKRSKPIVVPLTTLDDALQDYDDISLLKLDVQGYEAEVLKGAHRVLNRTRAIMTEVLYSTDYYEGALVFDDLYRLITSLAPFKLWVVSDPKISITGRPIWADAVFVRDFPG